MSLSGFQFGLLLLTWPRHQEQALDFMIQRETGDISENYRLWKPEKVHGEQK